MDAFGMLHWPVFTDADPSFQQVDIHGLTNPSRVKLFLLLNFARPLECQ
jgi:hypothetical protein